MTRHSAFYAVALLALGCAPLTFSEPAAIDFEEYRSVRVSVTTYDSPDATATAYFAEQLGADSGFEHVTTDLSDPVDLVLTVAVGVSESVDPNDDTPFDVKAVYSAKTPAGRDVDHGSETDDSSSEPEAVEDILDEVALHYIEPYRL